MSRALFVLSIAWLCTACIIEEPSPLGRPCNSRVLCGPNAVCDPQTNLCVSEDDVVDAAVDVVEQDWRLPDFLQTDDGIPDAVDSAPDQASDAGDDAPTDQGAESSG